MAKTEWGIKRTCQGCGIRFYDLRRTPPTCPKCQAIYELTPSRGKRSKNIDKGVDLIDHAIIPLDVDLPEGVEGDIGDDVLLPDEDDLDTGFDSVGPVDDSDIDEE